MSIELYLSPSCDPVQTLTNPCLSFAAKDPKLPISTIFSELVKNLSDWKNCRLTSKRWKFICDEQHPLILAVKQNQVDVVEKLLQKGVSVKLQMPSHLTKIVFCTPYTYAREHKYENLVTLLKDRDAGFSERYIKNKLMALQFQLDTEFNVENCTFKDDGLGHFLHHEYLTVRLTNSLKDFFSQFKSTGYWNEEKTKKLMTLLEKSTCLSCVSPEQSHEIQARLRTNQWIFLSDTAIFNHVHWINIVSVNSWLAIGNRGAGSHERPGVEVYKITDQFMFKHLQPLRWSDGIKDEATLYSYLPLPLQLSGCCSQTSFESGVLAGIFLILLEDCGTHMDHKILEEEAQKIFSAWNHHDRVSGLKEIMNEEEDCYDPDLLISILASFESCDRTAQDFWDFLLSRGIIPWHSVKCMDYALRRNNSFILNLIADSVDGQQSQQFLNKALLAKNYALAETLLKKGVELNGNEAYDSEISPFWTVFNYGDFEGIQWVLKHGADPNGNYYSSIKENKKHPLNCSFYLTPNIETLLLQFGAIKPKDESVSSPLLSLLDSI
jgi:hypothetical protein